MPYLRFQIVEFRLRIADFSLSISESTLYCVHRLAGRQAGGWPARWEGRQQAVAGAPVGGHATAWIQVWYDWRADSQSAKQAASGGQINQDETI